MAKKNKKPKSKYNPSNKKIVPEADIGDSDQQTVLWSFIIFDNKIDLNYPSQAMSFRDVVTKLKSYEQMTWREIISNPKRDHKVPINRLSNKAKKRLNDINQNDIDELIRFRFNAKQRIWGIREGRIFKVLWWDPRHEICPSKKK